MHVCTREGSYKVQALKPKIPKFPPLYRLLLTPGQVETDSSCFDRWVLKRANNAVNRRRMAIYVNLTKVKRKNRIEIAVTFIRRIREVICVTLETFSSSFAGKRIAL